MPPAASGSRCRSHCGIQPFGAAFRDSVVRTIWTMSNKSWRLPRHKVHFAGHPLHSQPHMQKSTDSRNSWGKSAPSSLDEYDAMRRSCTALIRGLPLLLAGNESCQYRCATCLSIYGCGSPLNRYVCRGPDDSLVRCASFWRKCYDSLCMRISLARMCAAQVNTYGIY